MSHPLTPAKALARRVGAAQSILRRYTDDDGMAVTSVPCPPRPGDVVVRLSIDSLEDMVAALGVLSATPPDDAPADPS